MNLLKIFCCLIVVSLTAFCNITISCEGANNYVKDMIMNKISEQHSDIEFLSFKINQITKEFSMECDTVSFTMPDSIPLNSDLIIKLDSYKNGNFIKRKTQLFRFEGDAKVYKTAKIIHNGDLVESDSLYESSINIQLLSKRMIGKPSILTGYQYRNYIDKDEIIENWMIERIPDISKGDAIKAVFSRSNITLTLDAKILENGYIGESAKVKIEKNKKVMLGKIYDKETIIISSR